MEIFLLKIYFWSNLFDDYYLIILMFPLQLQLRKDGKEENISLKRPLSFCYVAALPLISQLTLLKNNINLPFFFLFSN